MLCNNFCQQFECNFNFAIEDKIYCSQMDWTQKEGRVRIEESVMKVVNSNF